MSAAAKNMQRVAPRDLRKKASEAERRLWHGLRARRLGGLKFRRQHPIGPYIADFYCAAARLVVEVDGEQHGEPSHVEHDEARDAWMTANGLNVFRVAARDVIIGYEQVLIGIEREARPYCP